MIIGSTLTIISLMPRHDNFRRFSGTNFNRYQTQAFEVLNYFKLYTDDIVQRDVKIPNAQYEQSYIGNAFKVFFAIPGGFFEYGFIKPNNSLKDWYNQTFPNHGTGEDMTE